MKKLLILLSILFVSLNAFPQNVTRGRLNIEEEDASPSVFPYKLKFPNSSLTDNSDGTASIDFSTALGSSFAANSVIFSNGTTLVEDNPGLTYIAGTGLSLDDDLIVIGNIGIGSAVGTIDGLLHLDNGTSDTDLIIEKDAGTQARLVFHNAGVEEAEISYNASENILIKNTISNKDVIFNVNDGGVPLDLLKLDSSVGQVQVIGNGLKITSDASTLLDIRRTGTATSGRRTGIRFLAQTTGDMIDGFGPQFLFTIDDAVSSFGDVAAMQGARDGADNQGELNLLTAAVGGTLTERLTIRSDGTIEFKADNQKTMWGAGADWSISADTTSDFNITREVGTGKVNFGAAPLLTTGTLGAGTTTITSALVLAAGSITDTSGAIDFGNENLSTTGTVSTIELFNTAGDLKIQPDIQGDIVLFGDADVSAGNIDGKSLYIYRRAAEGDGYIRIFVDQYSSTPIIHASGSKKLQIGNEVDGVFLLGGNGSDSTMEASFNNLIYGWTRTGTATQNITFRGVNGNGTQTYFVVQGHSGSANEETIWGTPLRMQADNRPITFGAADDASIQFDGNSLNITANDVLSTDNLVITANLMDLGSTPLTTTGLGTFGNLDVDTLNLNGNVISDSTGAISFGNENLTTTGQATFGSTYKAILGDNSSNNAGYFEDGVRYVWLADGNNAIDVGYGSFTVDSSGNIYTSGTLTYTGGGDPPYTLWFAETREHVLELVRKNIPQGRENGLIQFYNSITDRVEYFKPSIGVYYIQYNGELQEVDRVTDGLPSYNTNIKITYRLDSLTGEIRQVPIPKNETYRIKKDFSLDINTGKFYNKNKVEVTKGKAIIKDNGAVQ